MAPGDNPLNSFSGESFDDLILETMENVLKQILGEATAKIIITYANKTYSSKGEENPIKAQIYANALREILGSSSVTLENLILKSLHSKLNLKFEEKAGYDFLDYINELREGKFEKRISEINSTEK